MESKNRPEKTIKIKLLQSELLKTYEEELKRWEDEGGNSTELNDVFKELEKPLNPGDVFEVVEGEIISEGEEFLYQVKIREHDS